MVVVVGKVIVSVSVDRFYHLPHVPYRRNTGSSSAASVFLAGEMSCNVIQGNGIFHLNAASYPGLPPTL